MSILWKRFNVLGRHVWRCKARIPMERNTIEPLLTPPSNDMVTSQDAPNYHAERSTVNLNSEVSNPEAYVTEYDLEA